LFAVKIDVIFLFLGSVVWFSEVH